MNLEATNTPAAGIRKAAVLLASLDPPSADLLLDRLDDEQADRVRRAITELDRIDEDERRRVIEEFRRIGPLVPRQSAPGIELSEPLPKRSDFAMPPAAEGNDSPPFGFLQETENDDLVQLLRDERPPTAALVLAHLPTERAGEVLDRLPPRRQLEVVRHLVDLENTDPQTLREVERGLEARLSRLFDGQRRGAIGPQSVARILESCDERIRRRILNNVAAGDPPLAERFGRRRPSFEDMARFDDEVLADVFRAADGEAVHAALLGVSPSLLARFLRCMAPEEARRLRRRLARPDPIRIGDVEDARQELAELAERLSSSELSRTAA